MEVCASGRLFILVTTLLSSALGAPVLSVDSTPSNYGTTETLKCTDTAYTFGNDYIWKKDTDTIFTNTGEVSTNGKYSESIDGTTFKLVINNIDVSDEGTYTCNHAFAPSNSLDIEVESRGNITAELLSSKYLEVTFKQIYPNTDITTITCDSTTVVGHFKSLVADGDRFINTWQSNDTFTTKPTSCSAEVTLRTTFDTAFIVTSATTVGKTGGLSTGAIVAIVIVVVVVIGVIIVLVILKSLGKLPCKGDKGDTSRDVESTRSSPEKAKNKLLNEKKQVHPDSEGKKPFRPQPSPPPEANINHSSNPDKHKTGHVSAGSGLPAIQGADNGPSLTKKTDPLPPIGGTPRTDKTY